jgi:hypothetical protein
MVKTLAKPMHYHRSLNCRASGLLELADVSGSSIVTNAIDSQSADFKSIW